MTLQTGHGPPPVEPRRDGDPAPAPAPTPTTGDEAGGGEGEADADGERGAEDAVPPVLPALRLRVVLHRRLRPVYVRAGEGVDGARRPICRVELEAMPPSPPEGPGVLAASMPDAETVRRYYRRLEDGESYLYVLRARRGANDRPVGAQVHGRHRITVSPDGAERWEVLRPTDGEGEGAGWAEHRRGAMLPARGEQWLVYLFLSRVQLSAESEAELAENVQDLADPVDPARVVPWGTGWAHPVTDPVYVARTLGRRYRCYRNRVLVRYDGHPLDEGEDYRPGWDAAQDQRDGARDAERFTLAQVIDTIIRSTPGERRGALRSRLSGLTEFYTEHLGGRNRAVTEATWACAALESWMTGATWRFVERSYLAAAPAEGEDAPEPPARLAAMLGEVLYRVAEVEPGRRYLRTAIASEELFLRRFYDEVQELAASEASASGIRSTYSKARSAGLKLFELVLAHRTAQLQAQVGHLAEIAGHDVVRDEMRRAFARFLGMPIDAIRARTVDLGDAARLADLTPGQQEALARFHHYDVDVAALDRAVQDQRTWALRDAELTAARKLADRVLSCINLAWATLELVDVLGGRSRVSAFKQGLILGSYLASLASTANTLGLFSALGEVAAKRTTAAIGVVTAVLEVTSASLSAYDNLEEGDDDAAVGHGMRAFGAYLGGVSAVMALTGVGAAPAAFVAGVGALFMIAGQVVVWFTDDTPLQLVLAHSDFGVDRGARHSAQVPGWRDMHFDDDAWARPTTQLQGLFNVIAAFEVCAPRLPQGEHLTRVKVRHGYMPIGARFVMHLDLRYARIDPPADRRHDTLRLAITRREEGYGVQVLEREGPAGATPASLERELVVTPFSSGRGFTLDLVRALRPRRLTLDVSPPPSSLPRGAWSAEGAGDVDEEPHPPARELSPGLVAWRALVVPLHHVEVKLRLLMHPARAGDPALPVPPRRASGEDRAVMGTFFDPVALRELEPVHGDARWLAEEEQARGRGGWFEAIDRYELRSLG